MKVKLNEVLKDIDGKTPLKLPNKTMTLKDVSIQAILTPGKDEKPEQKYKNYEIFRELSEGGEVDLSVEDVSYLKRKIGELFPPLIMGQAWDMLENKG